MKELIREFDNPLVQRDLIFRLQDEMMKMETIEQPLNHHFAPGVYAREILLKKDELVVGKIHKHAHLNIIPYGKVAVKTEDKVEVIEGYNIFVSTPGIKRVVWALEDTIWITIHITNKTDLNEIEEEIIAKDYEELS